MQWNRTSHNGWYAGLLSGLVLGGVAAALAASAEEAAERYESCVTKTATVPAEALLLADQWLKEKTTPAALHCRASSLFALKRYPEAAAALEALSKAVEHQTPLWISVQDQLAQSLALSGKRNEALGVLNEAVKRAAAKELLNKNAMLLIGRARLHKQQKQPLKALQDLDHAVSLQPENDAFALERVQLYLEMKQKNEARAELNTILKRSPEQPGARSLLQTLEQQ